MTAMALPFTFRLSVAVVLPLPCPPALKITVSPGLASAASSFAKYQSMNAPAGSSVATLHFWRDSRLSGIFRAEFLRVVAVEDIVEKPGVARGGGFQIRGQFRGKLPFQRAFFAIKSFVWVCR